MFNPNLADPIRKVELALDTLTAPFESRSPALSLIADALETSIEPHLVDIAVLRLANTCQNGFDTLVELLGSRHYNRAIVPIFDDVADLLLDEDLRLEDHFKIVARRPLFSHQALTLLRESGACPESHNWHSVDNVHDIGICRNLECGYLHPLSAIEIDDDNPYAPKFNSWAKASHLINIALSWPEALPGDDPEVYETLCDWIVKLEPGVDCDMLMYRARFDDAALLKLTELVHAHLDA